MELKPNTSFDGGITVQVRLFANMAERNEHEMRRAQDKLGGMLMEAIVRSRSRVVVEYTEREDRDDENFYLYHPECRPILLTARITPVMYRDVVMPSSTMDSMPLQAHRSHSKPRSGILRTVVNKLRRMAHRDERRKN